ncbi:PEP-CTERM sorting domain-containing protein [Nitrosomonas sp. sh817]|uniref:PEP-CTERM sorting domain-containing protein n=1 Tax=Nitrosomonas sp. sh817 TaxID=3070658 RepID=UPI0027DBCE33|nr:PEP-CTERM sorting domain-containing protein [Nitrosomonas sp. sh817]WMJ08306.1 PEP-CTERM sorting domain-containing protein [Nitrosomonas sp. sh817]
MKLRYLVTIAASAAIFSSTALAGTATIHLNGGNYIQSGSVTNTSAPGVDIVKVVYDLGTQADGIAIWEIFGSTGIHSNFLTGSHYSTETWDGLSVLSGNTFNFSGLDIDLITTVAPPVVDSGTIPVPGGPSLANASVSVYFSDGSFGTAELLEQDWNVSQDLAIAAVPEPETYAMLLAGLGLLGFAARRRQQIA